MIDEPTAVYIHEAQKHFEDLRQVASQLAGLLVLAASGARNAAPDHPMLLVAEQLFQEGADGVRRARATERAGRHHGHLLLATALLGRALTAARTNVAIDPILTPLRAAYRELQQAADSLPGFEMISFEHACCARVTR